MKTDTAGEIVDRKDRNRRRKEERRPGKWEWSGQLQSLSLSHSGSLVI